MSKKGLRRAGLILSLTMCMTFINPCYAAEKPQVSPDSNQQKLISTRAEQMCWYYRVNKGVKQKRLWSLTYGYWKTNWINC